MSWASEASDTLSVASLALHALEAIGPIAKSVIGDDASVIGENSLAKLAAISLAVDAIRKSLDGKISKEDLQAEIAKLHASHQSNLDATEAEIDKKFPTG